MAAHWCPDIEKLYEEVARVLKPGGAFVIVGASDVFLPGHFGASEIIRKRLSALRWPQPARRASNGKDGRALFDSVGMPMPKSAVWDPASFARIKYGASDTPRHAR